MRVERSVIELSPDGGLILAVGSPINLLLRYGTWEAGLPVHRWTDGQWVPESLDPGIPLLTAAIGATSDAALHGFRASVPPMVRQMAGSYQHLQTTMLQRAARSPAAADLLQQTPTLFWMLVASAVEERWTEGQVRETLAKQRKDILLQLTGIRSEAAVKLLNRVILRTGDCTELGVIRRFIRDQSLWRGLSHSGAIPVHLLAVLVRFPELAGARLLQQVAEGDYSRTSDALARVRRVADLWRDALRMGRVLAIPDAGRALARCPTFDAVERLHDRWVERINGRPGFVAVGRRPFPPPPLPGNEVIQPLRSEEELVEEGRLMGHCVASYAAEVRSGRSYIYRVVSPERATLEIRWHGSVPVIAQFKLAVNGKPGHTSWRVVRDWLAEHGKGEISQAV
jgi:hypothetical protein